MKKLLWGLLLSTCVSSSVIAGGSMTTDSATSTKMVVDMPAPQVTKYYKFDKQSFVNYFSGKVSSLQTLNCPKDSLLQEAGLSNTQRNWTAASYLDTKTTLTYSFDFANCSISAYQTNYDSNPKSLSPIDALATAKAFIVNLPLYSSISAMLGEPVIVWAYGNNMPYYSEKISARPIPDTTGDYIDADMNTNYSVIFPYKIDGKDVYGQYGNKMGVNMEVGANGVTSFSAQLLFPSGNMKKARRMTNAQMLSYINRGWNNQYRGNKSSVTLSSPKPIYVFMQDWRNGKSTNYLLTATLLPSSTLLDMNSPYSFYEMVVSDYVFANMNLNQYPR
jgi:hypothetical protein